MKKLIFILFVLCTISCVRPDSKQQLAERLVTIYLDQVNNNKSYNIISFAQLDTVFSSYDEELDYNKNKNNLKKVDSIKRTFKPKIKSWVMYVTYEGKNNVGVVGRHIYVCGIDKDFNKCTSASEIVN
jgi:hypothetical protein